MIPPYLLSTLLYFYLKTKNFRMSVSDDGDKETSDTGEGNEGRWTGHASKGEN